MDIIKIMQQFRRLGIPISAIFTRAARETTHTNSCGPSPTKVGHPCIGVGEDLFRFIISQYVLHYRLDEVVREPSLRGSNLIKK
jgi:hypothetical protein